MLLGKAGVVGLYGLHSTSPSVVNLCKFDILVVSNELFNHHGSSSDLDDQVVSQVLNTDLFGSINVVTLTNALPWHWAAELVDVLSQLLVNNVVLHRDVNLVSGSHWLRLSIQERVQLTLEVSDDFVLQCDLILKGFHLIVDLLDLAFQLGNNLIFVINFILLLLQESAQIVELLLMLSNLVKSELLLSAEDLDLLVHAGDVSLLVSHALLLLVLHQVVLISHLVQLIHAAPVEVNMLLNVHLVTIHDASQAVGNLICQILLRLLILLWHQLSVQLRVFLVEQLATLFHLRQVCLVWLLVFSNVTLHHVSDVDQTLVGLFLCTDDVQSLLVILLNSMLELSSKGSLGLAKMSESLEVALVLVKL